MTDQHALYRFFDEAGELLYIGITLNPTARFKQHRDDKPWWHEVAEVKIEVHPDRPTVLAAEEAAIRAESPRYNVVHNRGTRQLHVVPELPVVLDASEMPDDCNAICAKSGIYSMYFPYVWQDGEARYMCDSGHHWTRGWRQCANQAGEAPENRGRVQARYVDIADGDTRLIAAMLERYDRIVVPGSWIETRLPMVAKVRREVIEMPSTHAMATLEKIWEREL